MPSYDDLQGEHEALLSQYEDLHARCGAADDHLNRLLVERDTIVGALGKPFLADRESSSSHLFDSTATQIAFQAYVFADEGFLSKVYEHADACVASRAERARLAVIDARLAFIRAALQGAR